MSNFSSRRALSLHIGEALSYLELYAPDEFPQEDATSLEQQMEELLSLWAELERQTKSDEQRAKLTLPREETRQAWDAFRLNQNDKGLRLLQDASTHFRNLNSSRPEGRGFVVDSDGKASKKMP